MDLRALTADEGVALTSTANEMVAEGKGILAADESIGTIAKRFTLIGVESTQESRRAYRDMLFSTPKLADHISAVILHDETIQQRMDEGAPIPEYLASRGLIPGIKVDKGLVPLSPRSEERVTEGLDGLAARLLAYRALGARFAKWRAVYRIGSDAPSAESMRINAWLLGRYARMCQDAGMVPIVEPEVLMSGDHPIGRCAEATAEVLTAVFLQLVVHGVEFRGMLLKPNMVTPGSQAPGLTDARTVAAETIGVLLRTVPAEVVGITFLSGGQSEEEATANLSELARLGPVPWRLTFSFGRALQESALKAWAGNAVNRAAAQQELGRRASENGRALKAPTG